MSHKITIEIDSEKEWAAVCALSSLLAKPVSIIAKSDLISMTKAMATRVKEDELSKDMIEESEQKVNYKRLLAILD